ncbi:protein FAR-RED IMPAIRED RESPONSE 1-like [Abrus precatorius]|uniref:Protein FAR1-RELATED SEQUENCE n=1 Tax=Abrus precatorius TaxID=3816 RepID=A0A8B8LID1_ABRPR|nr:protein FAR-RED IMPAIRED RESPONSE 1-like [Abrus precatorius]
MEDSNNCDTCWEINSADNGAESMEEVDECDVIMYDNLNQGCEPCGPASGMSFPSKDAVKSFYRQYACRMGFGFMIRNSRKRRDGKLHYFILACSREGNRVPNTLKSLPTIKNNCEARITVSLKEDGLWYIMKAVLDHSHELSPTKAIRFKVNKNTNMQLKRTIETNHEARVEMNKTIQSLVCDVGGYENLSFAERDVRNYVQKKRYINGKQGDGRALTSYFLRMQEQNRSFFYDIDLDDFFCVKNVFWADARSRATYDSFGDVVTFDTTCLTNKYEMPFVSFVGVNHHGQHVLLGCGLLSTEETESFVWLFKSWFRCMSGNPPQGIVTDQCKAIQNAIKLVFPNTKHRWCLWHIMKKIPEKLKTNAEYNKNIKNAMKGVVYDTCTEAEFEDRWGYFVKGFNLQDNEWLNELYNERRRWVPIFLRKDFWAGMSISQRGENIHLFFDGYINRTTSLQQFVQLYDDALHNKVEKEFEADLRSFNTMVRCGSNSMIEKQFQSSYTHAKFNEVQAEFRAKINCSVSLKCVEGNVCTYDVLEDIIVEGQPKEANFEVIFHRDNHDVSCKCSLFEFRGIVCRHSLIVYAQERVKQVPAKYILPRWSKNIKWKHSYTRSSYDVIQLKTQMQRYDNLCQDFYEIAEVAAEFEHVTYFLQNNLCDLKRMVQSMAASTHRPAFLPK